VLQVRKVRLVRQVQMDCQDPLELLVQVEVRAHKDLPELKEPPALQEVLAHLAPKE